MACKHMVLVPGTGPRGTWILKDMTESDMQNQVTNDVPPLRMVREFSSLGRMLGNLVMGTARIYEHDLHCFSFLNTGLLSGKG